MDHFRGLPTNFYSIVSYAELGEVGDNGERKVAAFYTGMGPEDTPSFTYTRGRVDGTRDGGETVNGELFLFIFVVSPVLCVWLGNSFCRRGDV